MPKSESWATSMISLALLNQPVSPPASHYVGLHYGNPGPNGSQNELSGNGYQRAGVSFVSAGQAGVAVNSSTVVFGQATDNWPLVTHMSIWTAQSGGTCLYTTQLVSPLSIPAGSQARFLAGDILVREQ